jgi:hypothetical protein
MRTQKRNSNFQTIKKIIVSHLSASQLHCLLKTILLYLLQIILAFLKTILNFPQQWRRAFHVRQPCPDLVTSEAKTIYKTIFLIHILLLFVFSRVFKKNC